MREVWSGLDVSKNWFDASWVQPEPHVSDFASIPHRRFTRDPEGVESFLAWLDEQGDSPVRVVMEVTGRYSLELCSWLIDKRPELQPAMVNPRVARNHQRGLGLRNKTDKVDARSLGLMGKERRPHPYQELPKQYQSIRELMRRRRKLVEMKVAENQRLQEAGEACPALRRNLKSHLNYIDKLIQRLDKQLNKIVASCPTLTADFRFLLTLPGVGRITALMVLGELGDLRRFNRSRQVSAFSGLSPRRHESGTSVDFAHIDRSGNADLRAVLYMAAMTAVTRGQNHALARRYRSLIAQGKKEKQALVAIARKMLVIMRALVIHQQPYQDPLLQAGS